MYMEDLRIWERRGKLTIVDDADPVFVHTDGDGGHGREVADIHEGW